MCHDPKLGVRFHIAEEQRKCSLTGKACAVFDDIVATENCKVERGASEETRGGIGRIPRERRGEIERIFQSFVEHLLGNIPSVPGQYSVVCHGV